MGAFAIVAIVAALLSGAGSWYVTDAFAERAALVAKKEADDRIAEANQNAQSAAEDYEKWKAAQRPKTITITREVEREIKADSDCSARALPAGLRDALVRANSDVDRTGTYSLVPAPPAAPAADVGRLGGGLR